MVLNIGSVQQHRGLPSGSVHLFQKQDLAPNVTFLQRRRKRDVCRSESDTNNIERSFVHRSSPVGCSCAARTIAGVGSTDLRPMMRSTGKGTRCTPEIPSSCGKAGERPVSV